MKMMAVWIATAAFAGLTGVPAAQETTPDLKGRWVGTNEAVVLGKAPHHGDEAASPGKRRSTRIEITLNVDGQEGRRLWGTVESSQDQEAFIGVISFDGKSVLMQDTDGTTEAVLVDPDTMDLTYSHTTADSTVVAVNRVLRQK